MKEQHIDLLVERLQGTFPTSKISPKAVIGTWRKDEFLQDFPDELGLMLRERLQENCTDFPSLREVKFHGKKLLPRQHDSGTCSKCSGTGWVPEMKDHAAVYRPAFAKRARNTDGSPMVLTWQPDPSQPAQPLLYHFVIECGCVDA
jgi:hypothetical protein